MTHRVEFFAFIACIWCLSPGRAQGDPFSAIGSHLAQSRNAIPAWSAQTERAPSFVLHGWQYNVYLKTSGSYNLKGLFSAPGASRNYVPRGVFTLADSSSVQFRAPVSVFLFSQCPESTLVYVLIRDASIVYTRGGIRIDSLERTLGRDAQCPLLVAADSSGEVRSVTFHAGTSNIFQSLLREVLSVVQRPLPPCVFQGGGAWESEEFIPAGKCVVHYLVEPLRNVPTLTSQTHEIVSIRKSRDALKSRRRSPICGSALVPPRSRWDGSLTVDVDTSSRDIIAVHGEMRNQYRVGSVRASESTITIQAELVRRVVADSGIAAEIRSSISSLLSGGVRRRIFEEKAPAEDTAATRIADRPTIDEATLFRFCDSLQARRDTAVLARIARQAKLLVFNDSSLCTRITEYLSRKQVSDELLRVLSGALSEDRSVASQRGLVTLLRFHAADWQRLFTLIAALAHVPNPSPETESLLWSLADSAGSGVRSAAEQALAIIAHCLPAEAIERSRGIARRLADRISEARGVDRTCELISFVGNTGTEEALHIAEKYGNDSSDRVRRSSASALRWVENPRADTLLASMLQNDSSGSVRLEVLSALNWREPEEVTVKAEIAAAVRDATAEVRLESLRNLSNVRLDFPEVESVFRSLSDHDPAREVRDMARSLIGSGE